MKNGELTARIDRYGSYGVKVELGPWDEERFPTAEGRTGGFQFGMSIDLTHDPVGFGNHETFHSRVSIGGIQAHSPEIAMLRATTYVEAADIGAMLEAFTMNGGEFGAISKDAKQSVLIGYVTQILEDRNITIDDT